jgi:hypothetical protein
MENVVLNCVLKVVAITFSMLTIIQLLKVFNWYLIHKVHLCSRRKFWEISLTKCTQFFKQCFSFYFWMPSLNYNDRYYTKILV